ncbi:hypothetical protein H2248_000636 [Termitomyces sp. 'cryptogamus']|nr:hypothetical protein H2248_000636 [Termitomyces sp. 'cryptogamus']
MCGIFLCARASDVDVDFFDLSRKLQAANAARGPDSQGHHKTIIAPDGAGSQTLILDFYASELRLRGNDPIEQPHQKDGDVLCWNGEIFDGTLKISAHENDGVRLFSELRKMEAMERIRDLFGYIEGPYAFVYYQSRSRRLFFGRDPLGRRSLLIHKPSSSLPYTLLASVSAGADSRYDFEELSTESIFCLDLRTPSDFQKEFVSRLISLPRHSSDLAVAPFAEPSKLNTFVPLINDASTTESLAHVPDHLARAVDDLIHCLDRSVMLQVQNIPQKTAKGKARVAVLFSGGIDSTVITYLAHKHIPYDEPIDLLNVAFENPRKIRLQAEGNTGGKQKHKKRSVPVVELDTRTSYSVPDRLTGLHEVEELRRLCPERSWNFVEINVSYEESQGTRDIVESLMLPGRTVMDLSLALALYFASRGKGQVRTSLDGEAVPYTSPACVLLNGLGSDELLGGYGRHRSAYNSGGWQAVIEELQLEIDRIPIRNLGRDDRVISSHGKETRHPFLSLTVLNFLASLPVHHKMDPRLEVGLGDKMLLRMAAWKLGLVEASKRKKRAMQFGSHSARMDGERRGDTLLE